MSIFDDKTILITGGTGSFGKACTRILLNDHNPKAIRIYSRGEMLQWEMQKQFDDDKLRFFIGDIRDKERLNRAFNDVDIVIHAAALKQVPACEYNPIEAVKTNIDGAKNIINCALDNDVKRVMALSTDKAVHPVNLYGATKMVGEKLFINGNNYVGSRDIRFSCVRYGNVIGSRGSIVPLFLEQKQTGKITITDKRMTRFWITLEQGVELVLTGIEKMYGGEVFIPKIPSMKVTDLAKAIAPEAAIEIIGIRPGEKLHEVLITEDEARHTLDSGKYYTIYPEAGCKGSSQYINFAKEKNSKNLPEGFRYSSDNNDLWMSIDELRGKL